MGALFDTWVIGDTFTQDLAQSYEAIRLKAEKCRKNDLEPVPYLLQYYNVKFFYKRLSVSVRRTIGRILNSLIEALNEEHKLPRFLVVIIDKDIISDTDVFDPNAERVVADNVAWLIRQISILINRKKSEILDKCPGAVFTGDPKIVFCHMLRRYERYTPVSKLDLVFWPVSQI